MSGPSGSCRSFDQSADGYARTEAVVAMFVQRRCEARRIYATVIHVKSNTDGHKKEGINFPSAKRRIELFSEVYTEAGIDPSTVFFLECHGPGTKAGDPKEGKAITEVFCKNKYYF